MYVQVRLRPELGEWLHEEAERRGVSRTYLVERALQRLRETERIEAV
jgi:predicted transcriptional regulator